MVMQLNANGKNHSLKVKTYHVNINNLYPKPKIMLTKAKNAGDTAEGIVKIREVSQLPHSSGVFRYFDHLLF